MIYNIIIHFLEKYRHMLLAPNCVYDKDCINYKQSICPLEHLNYIPQKKIERISDKILSIY